MKYDIKLKGPHDMHIIQSALFMDTIKHDINRKCPHNMHLIQSAYILPLMKSVTIESLYISGASIKPCAILGLLNK